MGLVMLGSKSATAIEEMVGYAQETQHEPSWSLVRNCIELVELEQIVCYINELECVEGSACLAVPASAGLAELDGKFERYRQRLVAAQREQLVIK
ncbi:26S proteasome non-ATPase regulatory subunit 1 [Desmophyllum pertusum]|uniref:26S proteasome non-ATPase regulatory subunit 1 n=1 Tax=Desmophyllum pertusum TaxID=174260 RepID=A0A9W9YJT0_9CNID|nr:26S proteasome non-ATPase regulatory subunit 1 [Desmophyllum pertusum]